MSANMKFYPKILFISIVLLFAGCKRLPSEIKFFENYDFSTGEYKLLVFGTEGDWIDDYRDFYIDDIEVLKKMQKQWVFKYKTKTWACGYGYIVMLVDSNEVLKEAEVNIDCKYMTGWIRFPKRYLSNHKAHFKRMTEIEKKEFEEKYRWKTTEK